MTKQTGECSCCSSLPVGISDSDGHDGKHDTLHLELPEEFIKLPEYGSIMDRPVQESDQMPWGTNGLESRMLMNHGLGGKRTNL